MKLRKLEASLLAEGHWRVRRNIDTHALINNGAFDEKLRHHYGDLEIPYAVARLVCCKSATDEYLSHFFGSYRARGITVAQVLDTLDKPMFRKGDYKSAHVRRHRGNYVYDAIILAILWQEVQFLASPAPTNGDCVNAAFHLANECDKLIALLTEV